MDKVLQKIQIVSWGSILIGCFLAIKIPETLLSSLIFAKMSSSNDLLVLISSKTFLGVITSLAVLSACLIIGGINLLKKKAWARNFLEAIYWALLLVSLVQIGKTIGVLGAQFFEGIMTPEILFLELSVMLPLLILLGITILALNVIKNPTLKKILRK